MAKIILTTTLKYDSTIELKELFSMKIQKSDIRLNLRSFREMPSSSSRNY